MHSHHHACCGHGGPGAFGADPRFADDEFTQAAAGERRALAAHAHGMSLLAALLGGFFFLGIARKMFGKSR